MTSDRELRRHLVRLLEARGAHLDFDRAIAGLPIALRGRRPRGLPYSPWELLEHMRIAQWDILEFSRDPTHVSPPWPGGYWPTRRAPASSAAWGKSVRAFRADLRAMRRLVANPRAKLLARIPHGTGQTLLREALVLADHNAYHVGQLVAVRRLLGAWPAD
ncbi:MAG: ABC transporter [Candidatus Eisenbacteria bacterium RBG_16_71_46]|nr:MAG: ABC transporter [Candidatus Eisenbacteria bacterium RBG_16_71_46]